MNILEIIKTWDRARQDKLVKRAFDKRKASAERKAIELFTIERIEGEDYITFNDVVVSLKGDGNLCERLSLYRKEYIKRSLERGENL